MTNPDTSNELVKLLVEARTATITPAANAILNIANRYGIKGLECLAWLGSVNSIPNEDFVVLFLKNNAGINPLAITPAAKS